MTGNPGVVYRTSDPTVVAAYAAAVVAGEEWAARVTAHAAGVGGKPWVSGSVLGGARYVAVDVDGEAVPEGWRRDRDTGGVVPRVSTRAGKAAAPAFDALREGPDTRDALAGMPRLVVAGRYLHRPQPYLSEGGASVTVLWSCTTPPESVDGALWARVPLSAWHAEQEAADAAGAAGVAS